MDDPFKRWNYYDGPKSITRSGARFQATLHWNQSAEGGGVTGQDARGKWCDTEREAIIAVFEEYESLWK